MAPNNQSSHLVLTDHHSDHVFGMNAFREAGASVFGHQMLDSWLRDYLMPNFEEVIATFGLEERAMKQKYGNVRLSPLDETISQDTCLEIDGGTIEITVTPGHWEACLSVYSPSSKILFAGDTVYSGFNPTTRFGSKELWITWVKSLERLLELDIEKIVPGHGRVCGKNEIMRNISHLEKLVTSE